MPNTYNPTLIESLRLWTDRDGQTTPLGKAAADEIERLRGALADIAFSDDMTLAVARAIPKRIYETAP